MVGSAPSSPVYEPVEGRLAAFMSHWPHATDNAYVLRTVSEGIRIEFLERPPLAESLILFTRNAKTEAELCHHVEEIISKEVLELATLPSPGFYSNLFLVPKKSGGLRLVINLKPLNLFTKKEKFKMESTRSIQKELSPGDWVTSIDMKDAYFHILVHPDFRKYLSIVVEGKVFQFKALPFGLSPAAREFCRVTGVLGTLLHKLTIYLHLYLDDWPRTRPHSTRKSPDPSELGQVGTRPDSEVCPRRGLRCSSWASQAFQGSSR